MQGSQPLCPLHPATTVAQIMASYPYPLGCNPSSVVANTVLPGLGMGDDLGGLRTYSICIF